MGPRRALARGRPGFLAKVIRSAGRAAHPTAIAYIRTTTWIPVFNMDEERGE